MDPGLDSGTQEVGKASLEASKAEQTNIEKGEKLQVNACLGCVDTERVRIERIILVFSNVKPLVSS